MLNARKLPEPWAPPAPQEIYVQYLGPTSWKLMGRKYRRDESDTLTLIATLSAVGPVTAQAAHQEAIRLARSYVRRGTADSVVVSAARSANVQYIHIYVRSTLCPEAS